MELEEITLDRYDDGQQVVKEEERVILAKGAWSTVVYRFRERKPDGEFGDPKVRLVRYQKRKGSYFVHSRFNLTGPKQIRQLMDTLTEWFPE